jgi:energy-coupling factor transporter ATP-binding protein EcfA2
MRLTKLTLEKFKKVDKVELDLHSLNVLVGGNNSGKSSVLQGIHFSVIAAIASREAGRDTYTQDSLMFCPARNFEDLRHGTPYTNQTNFGFLRLFASSPDDGDPQYEVRIYRARNDGNVGCVRRGNAKLGALVASSDRLFSVYVPGLAGIPQAEQFRTESVVRRGVASGDANLYLRNVLWLIKEKGKLNELQVWMRGLFPKFHIWLTFDPRMDVFLSVEISTTGATGRRCPLELVGTGVLQALQIFSYVSLFGPRLLLLDEPDSHLHPDNQGLLARALQYIASETSTQIVVSTHSRHLVDALHDDSNFVWLKEGKVFKQGLGLERLPLLMDIGALDSFDRLMAGAIKWVFLSEDADMSLLRVLVEKTGYPMGDTLFFSYKSSSNLEPAKLLASFIKEIAPETEVVIHRDRDFMTEEEKARVESKIKECGAHAFVTAGCDLESCFLAPAHLSALLESPVADVSAWLDELAASSHTELQHLFTRKRDEIKRLLYRDNPEDCPDTLGLVGAAIPLPTDRRHGKIMLKKVRGGMSAKFGKNVNIVAASPTLSAPGLAELGLI